MSKVEAQLGGSELDRLEGRLVGGRLGGRLVGPIEGDLLEVGS